MCSSIPPHARSFPTLTHFHGKQRPWKHLTCACVCVCVLVRVRAPLPLSLCHSNAQVKCSCRLLYIIRVSKAQAAQQEKNGLFQTLHSSPATAEIGLDIAHTHIRTRPGSYTSPKCRTEKAARHLSSQSVTNHSVNQMVYGG